VAPFALAIGHSAFAGAEIFCTSGDRTILLEPLPKKSVSLAPKKNPETDYASGLEVCCLTRLLGPGGGVSGMEAARSGLFVNLRTQSAAQRSSVRQRGGDDGDDRFCSHHRR
jgi:hypothetical protein